MALRIAVVMPLRLMLTSTCPDPWRSWLLAPARLAVGLGICLGFGWPKVAHYPGYLDEVARSGAPMPSVVAGSLLIVELAGGAALAIGCATRLAAASIAIAMLGVLVVPRHSSFPWDVMPFLFGGYVFAVLGGGTMSVDHLLLSGCRRGTTEMTARDAE